MSKNNLAVIINVFNEEKNIKDCILSAKLLSKKIIVIDMESEDNTKNIAENCGAVIYTHLKTRYVEPARTFAIEKADAEWIFILDADERITPEIAEEVKKTTEKTTLTHFKIPRKNIFGQKKWLKYGGWYPDYQIRLIKKSAFINWPCEIHSPPQIKEECGYLKNPIFHYFHGDLENMIKKTIIFEDIESDLLFQAGKKAGIFTFFRKFLAELYRRLIQKRGFLDGALGIIESIYQAFSKTITYLFLYEKCLNQKQKNRGL